MLNASLGDPRVDAVALLDAMKSREIPIANKATLVARAKKEISLEPAAIQILLRNPQSSAGFSRWLFRHRSEQKPRHDPADEGILVAPASQ
jgi:hypothetical protein